jgi:hypothetical protein
MKSGFLIPAALLGCSMACLPAHAQSISGMVNAYFKVTAVNTVTNTLTVSNAAGLSAGTKVLLIQMKGATIDATNTSNYGNITAINDAGNYEFNVICSVSGNDVLLQNKLVNAYDPTGQVQLVSYPSYASATVSGTINGQSWDPVAGTGGVVVLAATNSITLDANIDVSGQGFQGGVLINWPIPPYNCDWVHTESNYYYDTATSGYNTSGTKGEGIAAAIANEGYGMGKLASGGGGGNNANSGGAGGANYGAGGNGGKRAGESAFDCQANYPGIGGLSLSAYGYSAGTNRIFLGSGGGSGEENNGVGEGGANGGGIIILSAPSIVGGGGQLLSNGSQPTNPACTNPLVAEGDGGGGGGAGGTIILDATTLSGSITAQAIGGAGSNSSEFVNDCTGPGGGGGGGVIWAAGGSFPGSVTGVVNGGVNGIVALDNTKAACRGLSNGAASGASGIKQTGYQAPMGSISVCTILAQSGLDYFTGVLKDWGQELSWAMYSAQGVASYRVERSVDQVSYQTIDSVGNHGQTQFSYDDQEIRNGTFFYRLAIQNADGSIGFSRVVKLTRNGQDPLQWISLNPNPTSGTLNLQVFTQSPMPVWIRVYNVLGQVLWSQRQELNAGYHDFGIRLPGLASGTYFLSMEGNGGQQLKRFVKQP